MLNWRRSDGLRCVEDTEVFGSESLCLSHIEGIVYRARPRPVLPELNGSPRFPVLRASPPTTPPRAQADDMPFPSAPVGGSTSEAGSTMNKKVTRSLLQSYSPSTTSCELYFWAWGPGAGRPCGADQHFLPTSCPCRVLTERGTGRGRQTCSAALALPSAGPWGAHPTRALQVVGVRVSAAFLGGFCVFWYLLL